MERNGRESTEVSRGAFSPETTLNQDRAVSRAVMATATDHMDFVSAWAAQAPARPCFSPTLSPFWPIVPLRHQTSRRALKDSATQEMISRHCLFNDDHHPRRSNGRSQGISRLF